MYTHSVIGEENSPAGKKKIVEDHFRARPVMSMKDCITQPSIIINGPQRFAEPVRQSFTPETDYKPDQTVRVVKAASNKR